MKKKIITMALCCLAMVSCSQKEVVLHESELITEFTHPLIKVALSSVDTVGFLIDTGSDFTVINELYYKGRPELFKKYGQNSFNVVTINGDMDRKIDMVRADLGNGMKPVFNVMDVSPMTQYLSRKSGIMVVGVIGSDYLTSSNAVLDFENNRIITREYVKASK